MQNQVQRFCKYDLTNLGGGRRSAISGSGRRRSRCKKGGAAPRGHRAPVTNRPVVSSGSR